MDLEFIRRVFACASVWVTRAAAAAAWRGRRDRLYAQDDVSLWSIAQIDYSRLSLVNKLFEDSPYISPGMTFSYDFCCIRLEERFFLVFFAPTFFWVILFSGSGKPYRTRICSFETLREFACFIPKNLVSHSFSCFILP